MWHFSFLGRSGGLECLPQILLTWSSQMSFGSNTNPKSSFWLRIQISFCVLSAFIRSLFSENDRCAFSRRLTAMFLIAMPMVMPTAPRGCHLRIQELFIEPKLAVTALVNLVHQISQSHITEYKLLNLLHNSVRLGIVLMVTVDGRSKNWYMAGLSYC